MALREEAEVAACVHGDVHIELNHQMMGETNVHCLEIQATCNGCGQRMIFRGMPFGEATDRPTMSMDGVSIMLPFLPEGQTAREEEGLVGTPLGREARS